MSSAAILSISALVSILSIGGVAWFAFEVREGPARCPEGLQGLGARCCGAGQTWIEGHCAGKAKSCGKGQELDATGSCTRPSERVRIQGEFVVVGSADWEGRQPAAVRTEVRAFDIDSVEVTVERYATCIAASSCDAV
ncbi:MAG TPA: hypothetical protein VGP93_13565, partial [Polyangiaceae bacterium]|nr:hypothetical protein [Polyangiaceae bacterium]